MRTIAVHALAGGAAAMSSHADAIIRKALVPGERLLWSGRPGIRFRKQEVISGAVVVFLLALAAWHDVNGIATLFGVVFAVPALCFLVLLPWDRAKLVYVVTDRRVLFVHRSWRRGTDAYLLIGMSRANVVLGANTVGFADFAKRCGYDQDEICMPEFIGLSDAWAVAQLIRAAVSAAYR